MSELQMGALVALVIIIVLLLGVPVAFSLGAVAIFFLLIIEGSYILTSVPTVLFGALDSFALLSIPMFILMGAAIASSRASADLYEAMDHGLRKLPGGLMAANMSACAVFAALSGSSPATCAAIGKMGIPEMKKRGYPDSLSTGAIAAGGTLGILIPPSVTMIVYGIATETSIGRLFIAGILPGLMLTGMFIAYGIWKAKRSGMQLTVGGPVPEGGHLKKVLPFLVLVLGILYVLYGGVATPSEAAGVGAFACLALVIFIYKIRDVPQIWEILRSSLRESIMILVIIACAELFSFMMSTLYITQSIAEWIAVLDVNRWVLMGFVNIFLLIAGFFLPPVAVILMTAPTLLPIIVQAGFDPIWFAVILTLNMEIGLITPPVGLNLYVINSIAPEVKLPTVLAGALPFMLLMVLGIVLLCIFPQIALWLPELLMGPAL
jgi:C4-dicarboxylate transporter DctM subunit